MVAPILWKFALGEVAEWSKVLTAFPWPLMVWSTLDLGTCQLRFVSWVFHVIFSFVYFISLYTFDGLHAFRKPLPYNMYLFNLRIANHILIKIIMIFFLSVLITGFHTIVILYFECNSIVIAWEKLYWLRPYQCCMKKNVMCILLYQ